MEYYDAVNKSLTKIVQNHTARIQFLKYLSACFVASSSDDSIINIWYTNTGELFRKYTGHTKATYGIEQIDNDTIVSGSDDFTIQIWKITTLQTIQTINVLKRVFAIKYLSNVNQLICGLKGMSDNLRIYDLNTYSLVQTLNGHSNDVNSIEILNEQFIATGSYDTNVIIWNLTSYTSKFSLNAHSFVVYCVKRISSNLLASGDAGGVIIIWDWLTGQRVFTLNAHANGLYLASLELYDQQTLISGSWDKTIKIWNLQTGSLIDTINTDIQIDALALINTGI